jgi:membrane fusion protein, multidrug efflux system
VAVIDGDGRVETRKVKLGTQMDHLFAVDSGLKAGELVIVEGQQNALPGAKVNARTAPTPRSAPLTSAETAHDLGP